MDIKILGGIKSHLSKSNSGAVTAVTDIKAVTPYKKRYQKLSAKREYKNGDTVTAVTEERNLSICGK